MPLHLQKGRYLSLWQTRPFCTSMVSWRGLKPPEKQRKLLIIRTPTRPPSAAMVWTSPTISFEKYHKSHKFYEGQAVLNFDDEHLKTPGHVALNWVTEDGGMYLEATFHPFKGAELTEYLRKHHR